MRRGNQSATSADCTARFEAGRRGREVSQKNNICPLPASVVLTRIARTRGCYGCHNGQITRPKALGTRMIKTGTNRTKLTGRLVSQACKETVNEKKKKEKKVAVLLVQISERNSKSYKGTTIASTPTTNASCNNSWEKVPQLCRVDTLTHGA